MTYVGATPTTGDFKKLDSITTSSATTFNLRQNSVAVYPQSKNHVLIILNGVLQSWDAFEIVNDTVVFSESLNSSDVINGILVLGNVNDIGVPSDSSVSLAKLTATGTASSSTFLRGDNSWAAAGADADNYFATSGLSTKDLGEGLHIKTGDSGASVSTDSDHIVLESDAGVGMTMAGGTGNDMAIDFADSGGSQRGRFIYAHNGDNMMFHTAGAERMRIDSSGNIMVGKTSLALGTAGTEIEVGGTGVFTASGNHLLNLNRLASDGDIVRIYQATSQEGSISVSGSTVSYNSFSGSHWSRLADNSKPTILRGTVMESISTLMDWYQVEYTKDEETLTEYIGALPDGKSVGDSHTVTVDGVEYTGTISKEDNEQLPKCKISDTEDSKAVYGVFMDWDNDDTVNDMYITALGAFVVRIHKDETVAIGDYLQSKGGGTAKKQADDILRASTIAKVTSTEKTHTYDDGSYCVPCTLHCG